jgi:colicin import membrane protein
VHLTPLAVDVDPERKLLAAQHQMREKNVAEQEARTAEFLARQQQAEANSARRVAAEQAARLEARQARNDARNTTDPAMPDANIAADDPAQAAALSRHQADLEKAERSQLRVQKYEAINDRAKDTLAQAVERTAKAKESRESAQKAQIQADKDRHLQAMRDRQEKLAKEKQEKQDAEEEKHDLEVKQQKEKLQQEKQAKLDAAAAKLNDEKAAKLKILQAEKAERAKLRDDTTAAGDAKKAAIQAEVEKNKKEAAILQAKLDKLNAANHSKSSTAQDAQKAKDTARARALLNDDEPAPVTPSVAPTTLVMVQIAMAESQAKADAIVAQLRAKGYKVRTSSTNKGVRVLVGPEKDAAAASAIKHKIEQDGSLKIKGAWVSNWQPPTS